MTLSINKTFVWEGITVKIALPQDYDKSRPYPAILLNDGQLNYLSRISSSVILIGLISNNRLDDYTPWKANALKPGNPDFGGRADSYHQKLFNDILTEIRQHYLIDDKRIAYGGYSLGGLAAVYSLYSVCEVPCVFSYLRFLLVPRFHRLLSDTGLEKQGLSSLFAEWEDRRRESLESTFQGSFLCWRNSSLDSEWNPYHLLRLWSLRSSWSPQRALCCLFRLAGHTMASRLIKIPFVTYSSWQRDF